MHGSGYVLILIPIPIPAFCKFLIPIPIPGEILWFQPNLTLLIPIPIPIPAEMWLIPESIPIPESCITATDWDSSTTAPGGCPYKYRAADPRVCL